MNINIQYVKLPFSEAVTEYVIGKLGEIGEKYNWITQARVFFKQYNDIISDGNTCEIELDTPGHKIFASSKDLNFELAAKETTREIEEQLKRRKIVLKAR